MVNVSLNCMVKQQASYSCNHNIIESMVTLNLVYKRANISSSLRGHVRYAITDLKACEIVTIKILKVERPQIIIVIVLKV